MPHQEIIEAVNLGIEKERKKVKIETTLSPATKKELIDLLQDYNDVFERSYQDMPGLDTDIVVDRQPLWEECALVKQKMRRVKPKMLLDASFLEVSKYPQWVTNIVPVSKKDGKVRMYVDYRDLNRASSKDNFPLPHIDTLVDNTAKHSLFSFMDGFSGYNQIKMALKDKIGRASCRERV